MKYYLVLISFVAISHLQAQINREWATTFNGEGDFNDRFTCMVRNASGDVLLGGSTTEPDADRDFLVVKIASTGEKIWQKTFNGSSGGSDEVKAIGVDAQGFTYITGISGGNNTSEDIWTIKLDLNGDSLWSRRYDYVNEYDQPNALFVDNDGNILVTGQSDSDPSAIQNDDYITIKYNSVGDILWKKRFNGLGNAIDRPVQVVSDPFGNAIVTGRSDSGFNDDFVTIKYDPAGNVEWALYDDRGDRDRPTAMTVDQNGAIYITGRSSNGSDDDFWTLKYNGAGIQQWNKDFDYLDQDRPVAIAIDGSGRVLVTGQSNNTNDWDFLTVAYSADGSQLWAKRYNGTAQDDDIPFAMNVTGNTLYITGQTDTDPSTKNVNEIITFASNTANGNEQWHKTYAGSNDREDAPSSVVGFATGCLVAGYAEATITGRRDALLLAYQSNGTLAWNSIISGIGDNNDNVRAIAVDPLGNIYAAGYSIGGGSNRNMAMLRFSPNGTLDCSFTLDGDGTGSEDDALALALDTGGNPVAAGFTKNSGTSNDLTFIKLNNNCDTLWTRKYDGPGHGSDRIYEMIAGNDGYFYATGRVDALGGAAANDNCITQRLDTDGNILWSKTYDGGSADRGTGIRQAANGDIYVSGRSLVPNGQHDGFLLKYNSAGIMQWSKTYNFGGDDEPAGLEITSDQRIIIGGSSTMTISDTLYDMIAIAYNTAGNILWQKTYNRGGNDEVQAITADNSGNFFLTAKSSTSSTTGYDISVVKYNSAGDFVWDAEYANPTGGDDTPDDIRTGNDGLIYATGHSNFGTITAPEYDIVTFIMNQQGGIVWTDIYNSPSDSSDIPNQLLVRGNTFYVAGSSVMGTNQRDILMLKYAGQLVDIQTPTESALKVSPNPFFGQLSVEIPDSFLENPIRFELFNSLGVTTDDRFITNSHQQLTFSGLPEGLYMYRISTQGRLLKTAVLFKTN